MYNELADKRSKQDYVRNKKNESCGLPGRGRIFKIAVEIFSSSLLYSPPILVAYISITFRPPRCVRGGSLNGGRRKIKYRKIPKSIEDKSIYPSSYCIVIVAKIFYTRHFLGDFRENFLFQNNTSKS
jgi:hypothetical protein